jgi:hypothetical protein
MLLVILISAAPDGGAPGSRPIGSAFDPATSAVAVARKHSRIAAISLADDARPPLPFAGASGLAVRALPTLDSLDFPVSPPLRVAHSRVAGDPRSLTRAHGARAPPLA